jgi:hypothetical protein
MCETSFDQSRWCDALEWPISGGVLTLVGSFMALWGIWRTWRGEGGTFLEFLSLTWVPSLVRRLMAEVREMVRHLMKKIKELWGHLRNIRYVTDEDHGTGTEVEAFPPGARVAPPAGTVDEQIQWLSSALAELRTKGEADKEALRAAIRETKVGGLQWEATGLFLVTIGAALAAMPSVVCPI